MPGVRPAAAVIVTGLGSRVGMVAELDNPATPGEWYIEVAIDPAEVVIGHAKLDVILAQAQLESVAAHGRGLQESLIADPPVVIQPVTGFLKIMENSQNE